MLAVIVPKRVEPVTKSTLEVIVWTINVCAVIEPVTIKLLFIVWTPSNVLLPVVAYLPFNTSWDAVNAFIEALAAYNEAVAFCKSKTVAFIELVNPWNEEVVV